MKKVLFALIVVFLFIGCISKKTQNLICQDMTGVYVAQGGGMSLELNSDGTYILWNPKINVFIAQAIYGCDYASEGKWSVMAKNVLEITSEDYYTKQKGFEYEFKKENKFSQDSLYFQVVLPDDYSTHFNPLRYQINIQYSPTRYVLTDKMYIVLPKSKYLSDISDKPEISFHVYADIWGTRLYRGRIMLISFDEYINTEEYNYFTINLPNIDKCFFEFEPYFQELIYIKGKYRLLWQGKVWERSYK